MNKTLITFHSYASNNKLFMLPLWVIVLFYLVSVCSYPFLALLLFRYIWIFRMCLLYVYLCIYWLNTGCYVIFYICLLCFPFDPLLKQPNVHIKRWNRGNRKSVYMYMCMCKCIYCMNVCMRVEILNIVYCWLNHIQQSKRKTERQL